jgi:hypothetical protein
MSTEQRWRWILLAASAMLALAAAAASHQDERTALARREDTSVGQMVIDREHLAVQAIRDQDARRISELCLTGFYAISSLGVVSSISAGLSAHGGESPPPSTFIDPVVVFVSPDVALLRYRSEALLKAQDNPSPPVILATAVWVLRDGAWKAAVYQETAIE